MFFQHVYDHSLAQASYFIGCQETGTAAVIDAKRDVDTYLAIARENNLTITHILETHIHADFLAGSRELAALTGGQLYLSDEGGKDWQYEFPHVGLKDGDFIQLGNLQFKVLHTPGHTPESISFLLTDTIATKEPVMLFTGDFVFVGDVGRPDLLEKAAGIKGTQEKGAHELYHSLKKFEALPDFVQMWPGHGAGSACGKQLGAVPGSTVGYEKRSNWAFQYKDDEEGFVKYLLADQPEPPRYFATMKKLNKTERPLLTEVPKLKKLGPDVLQQALSRGITVIDTRDKMEFANGFIPGSINIQHTNSFSTWAGWFLNYEEPFILLADESQIEELSRKLMRIGLDNCYGYVPSTAGWEMFGGQLQKVNLATPADIAHLADNNIQLIDVRGATEYTSGHIQGAQNIFVGTLLNNLDKISKNKPVIIHCQAGDRTTIAYSLLVKNGYTNVLNYRGGINDWLKNGNSLVTH